MRSNVEIKARARDLIRLKNIARELSETPEELIRQEDTFFRVPKGRLKLRSFSAKEGELIYYDRADGIAPRESKYCRSRTDDPNSLKAALASVLGVVGIVRKKRLLYMVGQVRIHLDEVQNLGAFVELEVLMGQGDTFEECSRIARDLMKKLEIREEDLVAESYVDLLVGGHP